MPEKKKPAGGSVPGSSNQSDRQDILDESAAETRGIALNLSQAAAILHCHPKTLRLMAQAQKIPARRVGKLWRFSEHTLREWLDAG